MNKQQISLFASKRSDDWATPRAFYNALDYEFHFDFDPCPLYSTFDGLACDWGRRNFVNPPYSKVEAFVRKAWEQIYLGNADVCVFLTFANTDTRWFHEYIYHHAEIRFVKGRLTFGTNEQNRGNGAMRPSMVCVLRNNASLNIGIQTSIYNAGYCVPEKGTNEMACS